MLHPHPGHGDHPDFTGPRVDGLDHGFGQWRVTRRDELRLDDAPGRRFRITCSAAVLIANGVSVEQAAYEAVRLEWSVMRALVEGLPREEADDDRTC